MAERKPIVTIGGVLQELPAADSTPGQVPLGGVAGQPLVKASDTDRDVTWGPSTTYGLDFMMCQRYWLP